MRAMRAERFSGSGRRRAVRVMCAVRVVRIVHTMCALRVLHAVRKRSAVRAALLYHISCNQNACLVRCAVRAGHTVPTRVLHAVWNRRVHAGLLCHTGCCWVALERRISLKE